MSTCVGEEGLDIGEVDLIICFDAHKSPIRLVQRMGRTGRKRSGRIVVIVGEGKEEQVGEGEEGGREGEEGGREGEEGGRGGRERGRGGRERREGERERREGERERRSRWVRKRGAGGEGGGAGVGGERGTCVQVCAPSLAPIKNVHIRTSPPLPHLPVSTRYT